MQPTSTTINQDYQGPTRNPHGEALARLTHQFQNVKGPEQARKVFKAWGLRDVSPRQARFWDEGTRPKEKALFCDLAQVSPSYARQEWRHIPAPQRRKLWQAIGDAAAWGEKLRGRF